MKSKILDIITYGLLALAVIGTMILLGVDIARANETENHDIQPDSTMFLIENTLYLEELEDGSGYVIFYAKDDTTFVNLYTSNIEGDYLMAYMDCWELYRYHNSEEDLDDLRSYLLNNSHIGYEDNEYFTGYVWYYDACPIYRFDRFD